jgi:hypothetical protein
MGELLEAVFSLWSVQRLHNENEREKCHQSHRIDRWLLLLLKKREGKEVLSLESRSALVVRREDIVEIRYQATTNKYGIATS